MEEQYQPQSYVYEGQSGAPEPVVKNRRWVVIGVVVILVIILFSFVTIFFVNRSRANRAAEQAAANKRAEVIVVIEEKCNDAELPEECLLDLRGSAAQKAADVAYCDGLASGTAYDSCAMLAAIAAADASYCDKISDATKKAACNDAALSSVASADRQYDDCRLYSTTQRQDQCRDEFVIRAVVQGVCDPAFMDDVSCDAAEVVARAIAVRDPDLCLSLSENDFQDTCVEVVGVADRDLDGLDELEEESAGSSDRSIDSDNDGLTDADEVNTYGTNPASADTDGDGFTDGTEVNSGYNPNGPGML